MKSNTAASNLHRQLLVNCTVTNKQGNSSERFVDHSEFPLWQFLMEQRHGLQVSNVLPCVWVPEDQCRRHDKLLAHTAFQVPVYRITFEKFDADSGVTGTQVRWVPQADYEDVNVLLEQHLVACANAIVVERQTGEAISTSPAKRRFTERPAAAYYAA